jgi:hypothetical protein
MSETDLTIYKFETHDGLPPNGEKGQFFGFDANQNAYILRWDDKAGCWVGVGFDPKGPEANGRHYQWAFIAQGDMAGHITSWAPAPYVWPVMTEAELLEGIASLAPTPSPQ